MDDFDKLDKLARKVNNNINNRTNIDKYLTGQYDKGTKIEPITEGFYSAQGQYSKFNKVDIESVVESMSPLSSLSDDASLELDSFDSNDFKNNTKKLDEILSDNFDIRQIDHEIKTKSKFNKNKNRNNNKKNNSKHICDNFDLHSIDSIESLESGESLLRHIRHCDSCKKKVVDLIKNHKNSKLKDLIKSNKYSSENEKKITNNDDKIKFNMNDSKEIIIAILIGILIIFILDFMF